MIGTPAAVVVAAVNNRPPAVVAAPQPIATIAPPDGSRESTAFPTIAANVKAPFGVRIAKLRMLLDTIDVTHDVSFGGTSITYIPRQGLLVGTHTVQIAGSLSNGQAFAQSWAFETTQPALQSIGPPSSSFNSYGSLTLSVSGSVFGPNQIMPVQLVAPPGGQAYAFVCNSPWQYPMYASPSSPFYSVTLQAPWGRQLSQCPVTAMYIGPNGEVLYAPFPVFVTFAPVAPYQTPAPRQQTPTPSPLPMSPSPAVSSPPRHIRPIPVVTRTPQTPGPVTQTPAPESHPIARPPVRVTPRPLPIRTKAPDSRSA